MKTTKVITINGKSYSAEFNANHELSQSVAGLEDSVLIELPRVRVCSNGIPVVKDDAGKEFRLGYKFLNKEELQKHKDYDATHKGSGTSKVKTPVVPVEYAKEVLNLKGISEEARTFFENIVKEAEEAQKAKMEKAKNLLSGFSKEELAALKAILG